MFFKLNYSTYPTLFIKNKIENQIENQMPEIENHFTGW